MNPTWRTLQPLLATVFTGWLMISPALGAGTNTSAPHARTSPAWVRSAVVYEIFPRNFSAQGDFNAITERLDELQHLGVDVLWLMPIHPVGQKLKKGSLGSPYSVRDY
ncbi:MAG: alpha-amylase family glycosyl hydrolase, partial [Verrucomicrobia bacterium]|nr:alpha-amylase family glycosyl hydrolase [Verrucomicrobiota bacterium]